MAFILWKNSNKGNESAIVKEENTNLFAIEESIDPTRLANIVTSRFSENLSNSEILVIPIPEYESTPKDANSIYNKLLRVAQFRSAKEAEKLVKQLTTKDFPNVQLTNSTWYFVTVGPFESRSLLNKAQDIMAQMNYVPQVITLK